MTNQFYLPGQLQQLMEDSEIPDSLSKRVVIHYQCQLQAQEEEKLHLRHVRILPVSAQRFECCNSVYQEEQHNSLWKKVQR